MLNKQGYESLPPTEKKNAVKYWNFTTHKDAYYSCPNPKYPYLKFVIKRHPKDYCIPCCKKSQITDDATNTKRIIYDACIKDHQYSKEERTITQGSRYIMTYGKDVEPGRLSKLPECSLEPMFYETYSSEGSSECTSPDGYYIYGIEQSLNKIENVGILNIFIHALGISLSEFVETVVKLVKSTMNKFRVILNGDINRYFNGVEHFITTLRTTFLTPNDLGSRDIPWNDIFINIAYLFMEINVITFTDNKHESVKLHIPSYISNKENFIQPTHRNLIVLVKRGKYFPIYFLNTVVFFKTKLITKNLFSNTDDSISIIRNVVKSYFGNQNKNVVKSSISLPIIQEFAKETNHAVEKLFINKNNMCYYVQLTGKNTVSIPVELSYHLGSDLDVSYGIYSRNKNSTNVSSLLAFAKDFNKWVAKKSERLGMVDKTTDSRLSIEQRVQPIYPYIEVDRWIVMELDKSVSSKSKVIGFVSNSINYYARDIKLSDAMKLAPAKLTTMYYEPDLINRHIFMKTKSVYDKRCLNFGQSVYNKYLYRLVLLEFITMFSQQKNEVIRSKIKKKMLRNLNTGFKELIEELHDLIDDDEDSNKLKRQICNFVNLHGNKNALFKEIESTFYNFDKIAFDKLKTMSFDKLVLELKKISKKFVSIGDVSKIKNFDFPNMFVSCRNKMSHCKNGRLIISQQKLKDIIEVIASDILNPSKEKWLFSYALDSRIVSYFKFIRRPDETIYIDMY